MTLWTYNMCRWALWVLSAILFISTDGVESREHWVVVGYTVEMVCTVDYTGGQPRVIWMNPNGVALTDNEQVLVADSRISVNRPYNQEYNLVINGVKTSDQGSYHCMVDGNQEDPVTLWVKYPPSIVESPTDLVSVESGEMVNVSCRAEGFPDAQIHWYKYTVSGDKQELLKNSAVFLIQNVSRDDAGSYECLADNGVSPPARASWDLDVKFAPSLTLPYQVITQKAGRDTLLECVVTSNPPANAHWHKGGTVLQDSDKYKIHVWDIGEYRTTVGAFVFDLHGDDFGEYSCVAENQYGDAKDSLQLYEWKSDHLHVTARPADAVTSLGSVAQFNCTVHGLTSTDSVTWWREFPGLGLQRVFISNPSSHGDVVYFDSSKYRILGHYNLQVLNVTADDSGMYMCEVSSQQNHTAQLTVTGEVVCSGNTSAGEGDTVNLLCQMDYVGPAVSWQVYWLHGMQQLASIKLDTQHSLVRQVTFEARPGDEGTYTCHVSSQSPSFSGRCAMDISVDALPSTSPLTPEAFCKGANHMTTLYIMFGTCVGGLILVFLCVIAVIVTHYKRMMSAKRASSSSTRYRNGGETVRLTGGNPRCAEEMDV